MSLHSTIPHGNHSPCVVVVSILVASWKYLTTMRFCFRSLWHQICHGQDYMEQMDNWPWRRTTSGQFRRTSDDVNLPPVSEMYVPQCRDPTTGSRCKKCLATYLDNSIEPWTDKVHPAVPEIYVLRSPAARPLKSGTNKTHPVRRAMR